MHAFSNPGADGLAKKFGIEGLGYDRRADSDSWARLLQLLADHYQ